MTYRRFALLSILTLLLAGPLLTAAGAQEATSGEREEMAARGRVSFRVYCSNCHGAEALGDGELADLLKVAPADLTRLTEKYEGEFPSDWIHKLIDGRKSVRGHGMAEMPVWGLAFRNPEDSGRQDEEIGAKIDDLVAYIESIQVAGQEGP